MRSITILVVIVTVAELPATAQSDSGNPAPARPWMNVQLSPDERADLVVKEMTLAEKISLLHGTGMKDLSPMSPLAAQSNGGAGYVVGIPRLGIPGIQMSDAAYGVRHSGDNGRYSTALPDDLAGAASWDLDAAYEYGALIGRELRDQGYNMSLGGGVNLAREPRDGRTFEYMGEDPLLAGKMVAQLINGTQAQHVLGDIKHYALNDQESGRNAVNVNIDKRSMRETDLLAFEIGLRESNAAAVMCSYNRANGAYACENKYLLRDVLKKAWNFNGFVLSDWGGTHSAAEASAAGLDHEEPGELFYGAELEKAVNSGRVPLAELDDHVHRILRSMFATGVIDDPTRRSVVDVVRGFEVAQKIAEQSIVLLKNDRAQLPLDASQLRTIAVIGAHSDVGMLSGGGSAQVDPPGGNAIAPPGAGRTTWQAHVWFPTSPLKAIRARAPGAKVQYDPGADLTSAAALAKTADVAIVFAHQWESEGMDLETLSLPEHQDDGGGCQHPLWRRQPSAKLPITFPKSDADLPHPTLVKPPKRSTMEPSSPEPWKAIAKGLPAFQVTYDEGLKVGYKWYDAERKEVLFPFGYGLSYTSYSYSNLKLTSGKTVRVSFRLTNTGPRAGAEIAQVYAALPASAGEPPKRLVGWSKVKLDPGESKSVTIEIDPWYLSVFDINRDAWQLQSGEYKFLVGGSSRSLPLEESINLK